MVWVEEDVALRCFSSSPFSIRIKRKRGKKTKEGLRKKVKPRMVDDDLVVRKSIKLCLKGKEKMYELPGTPTKGSQVVVTNYQRAVVNGKAKMIEDVGLVQEKVDVGIKQGVRRKTNVLVLLAPGNLQKQPGVSATKVQESTVKVCQLTCSVL
ncbi:hypothetical protein Tco_0221702 [Tanacetum coccineum]